MPITGTFNGLSIVQLPAKPTPKSIEFTAQDVVAVSQSPFTGRQQIYDWQNSWLEASVQLPAMKHPDAQAWIGWLLQLRGMANVFQLGDPAGRVPRGTASGAPLVNGANQTGYTLATRGWTANAAGVLQPGDWLQIGYRLYRNLNTANADGSGLASLALWPNLRESPADGAALVLSNTKGLWRLKTNARKWSLNEARLYGLSFEIREAI